MKSNPYTSALIVELKTASIKEKAAIWKRIATDLEKPTKKKRIVNLSKIERYSNDNETVVVPGKVLGMGDLSKKVTIAAESFSKSATDKLKALGLESMSINELLKKNPKGSKIKIIG